LSGDELLDGLPQRGDIQRYLMHLLRVEGGGGMSAFGGKADIAFEDQNVRL
jgi:hypothetical protein